MNLGIRKSFSLLFIPLSLATAIIAWVSYRAEREFERQADLMVQQSLAQDLASQSTLAVAEMGSHLKSFLLDPKNKAAADAKEAADEANGKALDALLQIPTISPQIETIVQEMKDLDDKQLDPTENLVLEIAGKGKNAEAQEAFAKKYMPIREKYDQLSQQVLNHAEADSKGPATPHGLSLRLPRATSHGNARRDRALWQAL